MHASNESGHNVDQLPGHDIEAVKAMLDATEELESETGISATSDFAPDLDKLAGPDKVSFIRKAKALLSNDVVSPVFSLVADSVSCQKLVLTAIGIVAGTAILASPAITVWLICDRSAFDPLGPPGLRASLHGGSNGLQETFRWSLIGACSWLTFWLCNVFFYLLPFCIRNGYEGAILRCVSAVRRFFSPRADFPCKPCAGCADDKSSVLSDVTWRHIKHFLALSFYLTCLITLATTRLLIHRLVGTYDTYVQGSNSTDAIKWASARFYALAIPDAALIVAVAVLIEKWLIQRIAVYFHGRNHKARVSENNFCLQTLQVIRTRMRAWNRWWKQQKLKRQFDRKEDAVPFNPITGISGPSKRSATLHTSSFTNVEQVAQDIFDTLRIASFVCSRQNACTLAGEALRDFLVEKDFLPFCRNAETARRFARMLDQDENGNLTRQEVVSSIKRIYDERDALDQALACNDSFVRKLDGLLLSLAVVFSSFYWLSLFDTSVWSSLTAFGGFALGLKFVFEASASASFIAIIFSLVVHPYDIGDVITIDNGPSAYTVIDIDLWTTTLNGPNGLAYISNVLLSDSIIGNIRRSEWQLELISIRVTPLSDPRALRSTLSCLQAKLVDFATSNPRDYQSSLRIQSVVLESATSIALSILIPYRSNFFDARLMDGRRQRMTIKLAHALQESGLEHSPVNRDWGRVLQLP